MGQTLRGGANRLLDLLQANRFWLLDMIPSSTFPFFVLGSPIMGYQSVTMPELTLEVDEIKQLNSMYKRYAYSGGSIGAMTLMRGTRAYDDSFMLWIDRAIKGLDMVPRNLLLIQYTNINLAEAASGQTVEMPAKLRGTLDAWEVAQFLPGRAWLLWDCIPTRYKPGSDFDPMSGEVSIMELDIQPHAMTEFALLSVT